MRIVAFARLAAVTVRSSKVVHSNSHPALAATGSNTSRTIARRSSTENIGVFPGWTPMAATRRSQRPQADPVPAVRADRGMPIFARPLNQFAGRPDTSRPALFRPLPGDETKLCPDETTLALREEVRKPALCIG